MDLKTSALNTKQSCQAVTKAADISSKPVLSAIGEKVLSSYKSKPFTRVRASTSMTYRPCTGTSSVIAPLIIVQMCLICVCLHSQWKCMGYQTASSLRRDVVISIEKLLDRNQSQLVVGAIWLELKMARKVFAAELGSSPSHLSCDIAFVRTLEEANLLCTLVIKAYHFNLLDS